MSPIKKSKKKGSKKGILKKRPSKKIVKKVQVKAESKKAPPKKATKSSAKNRKDFIGEVTHYFAHVNAAVVKLKQGLAIGDTIHVKGHTTDFTQVVTSIQLDHEPISAGKKGQEIGLEVKDQVRTGDQVFRAKGTTS